MRSSEDTCGKVWLAIFTPCGYTLSSSDATFPVKDLDESNTDSLGIVFHGTNVKIDSKV